MRLHQGRPHAEGTMTPEDGHGFFMALVGLDGNHGSFCAGVFWRGFITNGHRRLVKTSLVKGLGGLFGGSALLENAHHSSRQHRGHLVLHFIEVKCAWQPWVHQGATINACNSRAFHGARRPRVDMPWRGLT